MQFKDKKNSFSSLFAGCLLRFASAKNNKTDIRKSFESDLSTGTSRRNIRFTEKIRDKFRHRWLKATNSD